jgi:prophage antirepressor-like protein
MAQYRPSVIAIASIATCFDLDKAEKVIELLTKSELIGCHSAVNIVSERGLYTLVLSVSENFLVENIN